MISVTKQMSFCYGHYLPDHPGKCRSPHGHNSKIQVTVEREDKDLGEDGMVIDFGILKKVIEEAIGLLDHSFLNDNQEVPQPPTIEHITRFLAIELSSNLPFGVYLTKLLVSETDDCWAEWRAK